MSLIADALKAAQQERTDRSGGAERARKRQAAASALRTSADFTPARSASGGLPRALWASLALFAVATAGAIAFVLRVPPPGDQANIPEFGSSAEDPALAVAPEPRTELPHVDLGTLPPTPAEPAAYVEYADPAEPGAYAELAGPVEPSVAVAPEAAAEEQVPGEPRSLASRAAAVIAAAQELLTDDLAAETIPEAPSSAQQQSGERAALTRPASPPGRFNIQIGEAAAVSAPSFNVAVAAQRRGDYRTAVHQYLALLEADPENIEAINNLGASYQSLGDLPRARQTFERAIAIAPSYAAAWSNLGLVLGAMGIGQEALAALTEAVQLEPSNPGTRVNLALAYERLGRTADARRVLEEVVRVDPQHAEAHYALGRVLEAMGDRAGAAGHFRIFLTFGASRFPQLDGPVRERIRVLEETSSR